MFQVLWRQRAINDLAVIWIQADSTGRQAITEAASTIDRTLQDEPFDSSESRGDEDRVFFAPPPRRAPLRSIPIYESSGSNMSGNTVDPASKQQSRASVPSFGLHSGHQ
jgi:hypothetical protein